MLVKILSCRKKSQAGVETFVVTLIIVMLFVYGYITYIQRNRELEWSDSAMKAQRECYSTSLLINRVRSNGYGFAEKVSFDLYRVMIFGNTRGVEVFFPSEYATGLDSYYCSFLTSNVTNTTDFTFEVFGDYRVVNEGENITFYVA